MVHGDGVPAVATEVAVNSVALVFSSSELHNFTVTLSYFRYKVKNVFVRI